MLLSPTRTRHRPRTPISRSSLPKRPPSSSPHRHPPSSLLSSLPNSLLSSSPPSSKAAERERPPQHAGVSSRLYALRLVRIFGSTWDAPVCEGKTAEPAPLGEECLTCNEPITESDEGYILPCFRADHSVEWLPQHKECSLLTVIGHEYGLCGCTDYAGLSMRQAGIRLWQEIGAA